MKKITLFFLVLASVYALNTLGLARLNSQAEETEIGTCARFTSDRESCMQCISHYHLFEGQCYRDIHGCSQYIFGSICQKCDSGFILVNNECCDKHCMARIFKNYQEESIVNQESESEKLQRLTIQGYEKTVSKMIKTVIINANYQFLSTSNQILLEVIRYNIRVMINKVIYRAIADFSIASGEITVIEFRPEVEMSKVTQTVLYEKEIVYNEQAKKAFQLVNGQYGLRIYGYSLGQVLVTKYKFANEYRFIYLSTEKQSVFIFTVVVPTRSNSYTTWVQERNDINKVNELIQTNLNLIKVEQNPEFQVIKEEVIKQNQISSTQITVKTANKIDQNVFQYEYVNKVTGQVFQEKAKVNVTTNKVDIISHKEVVSTDVQSMKLPPSPVTKIITKQNIPANPQIKQTIRYLSKVQPSLANKEITNAEIQQIGDIHKITLMQKKDEKTTRVVVIKDQKTDKITLVDESVVQVTPPTKTIVQKTEEGTKKIVTNKVQNLMKIDSNIPTVIEKTRESLPNIDFDLIEVASKKEGNLVNTYTFVVDTSKDIIGDFKQQVVVIQNKETNAVKVVDVEELETKPILNLVKRPVVAIPSTDFQTYEIKNIVATLQQSKPELKNQQIIVKSVTREDKKFVNKYEVIVETQKGQTLTVTANQDLGDHAMKVTDVRQITKTSPVVQRPYIQQVTVDSTTGVKTTITTNTQEITKSPITETALQSITSLKTKPTTSQIVSLKTQKFETTELTTVLVETNKPEQYVQVVYEKPIDSPTVTYIGEDIVTIQPSEPLMPVVNTQKLSGNRFSQVIKTDTILQTVTSQVTVSQPTLVNVVPELTTIVNHDTFKQIVMVYKPTQSQKQRVLVQYDIPTQKVLIKESTPIPVSVPEIFLEKEIISETQTKIISNKIEEIIKEDQYVPQVFTSITQKYPLVQDNLLSIQVVQSPNTNNYIVSATDVTTKQIITIDVSLDKDTQEINWIDYQQIPEDQLVQISPVEKPQIIYTPEEIQKSSVIENLIPTVQVSVSNPIKEVMKVTETKSTLTTTYDLVIVDFQDKKQIVTVLVDNKDPADITVINVVSEVPQQTIISPVTPVKTIVSTDSANVVKTITNDPKDFNNYLQMVKQTAENKQPLLSSQEVICYTQEDFSQNIEITYLASTQWGNIKVVGFINKTTNSVALVAIPLQFEGRLETVDDQVCESREQNVIKHQSIGLVSQKDPLVQKAIDYVILSNNQASKINEIKYQVVYLVRIFIIVYEVKTTIVRTVIKYSPETSFEVVEKPVPITIQQPTAVEVTKKQDVTIVSTNSVQQILNYDPLYPSVITQVTQQYPTIAEKTIVNVVSTSYPTHNQYTLHVKNPKGVVSVVQMIYQKEQQNVIVTELNKQTPQTGLVRPRPRTGIIVPKDQFSSQPIQQLLTAVHTDQKTIVSEFTTEQVTSITKVDTPFASNYEIVYTTPKGPETVVTTYNEETKEVRIIDYKPVQTIIVEPTLKPVKTEFYIQPWNGAEVTETNDVTVINNNKIIQSVKLNLVQQKVIEPQTKIVETLTKKTSTKVQTTIVTQTYGSPTSGKAIVTLYDPSTDSFELITEKPVELSPTEPLQIREFFPSTVVSQNIYAEVVKKDTILSSTVQKIVSAKPELKLVDPSSVSIDQYGSKVITTVVYEEKNIVSVAETDINSGVVTILETYEKPKTVQPVVYETEVIEGTVTTVTNNIEKITEKEPAIPIILSEIKVKVPELMTEQIEGIRVEESNGIEKIYIVSKSDSGDSIQVSSIYDKNTKQVTLMDVRTVTQQEIAIKPEKITKVQLSTQEIKQEKIQEIITQKASITKIPGVQQIVKAEETITGYGKIVDVIVQGTDGNKYIVKTEKFQGKPVEVVDVVTQKAKLSPEIFTEETLDSNTGIVFTRTNNLTSISEDRYYPKWTKYLEDQYQVVSNGYVIQSQTASKLQRTNEYTVRYVKPNTSLAHDFRLTVDRTGKITVLEQQEMTLTETEYVSSDKSAIEIVQSQVNEALVKFPVVQSSVKILQSADYTFENRVPYKVYLKKYDQNTEIILMYASTKDPEEKSRIVLMAETEKGTSITGVSRIPKILDISILPKNIETSFTKTVKDPYGRSIIISNDILKLNQNTQYTRVIAFIKKQLPVAQNAIIEEVEVTRYAFANQYTIKMFNGKDEFQVLVSANNQSGEFTLIDFRIELPKSGVQKIPVKAVQTVDTIIPAEQYSREDIQIVKTEILKELNTQEITLKNVVMGENQRINLYTIQVETPDQAVKQIVAVRDTNDKNVKIISTKTVYQPEAIVRTPESTTSQYIQVETNFITQQTNDPVIINQNPIVSTVKSELVKQNIIKTSTKIVESRTKTSQNIVETTLLIDEPTLPSPTKAIVTIFDKNSNVVQIVGEKTVVIPKDSTVPALDKVMQTTVINQDVYQTVKQSNQVLQSITTEIVKAYPSLVSEVPQSVTQTILNDKILSTVTYPQSSIVTEVITDTKTYASKVLVQEPFKPFTQKPTTTTTQITKQGRHVVTTNDIVSFKSTQPKFNQVLTQLTDNYQILQNSIQEVTSTETFNGAIYDVLVDQGDGTFSQIQVLTTKDDNTFEINDFVSVTETEILEFIQEEVCYELTVEEIQVNEQVQNVVTVIKGDTAIPQVLEVTEVKVKPTQLSTLYQLTTQTTKGKEVVTVAVNRATQETQIIDHRPVQIVKQIVSPSITSVSVDSITGVKTTATTDIKIIQKDSVVSNVVKSIGQKDPIYNTWEKVSVIRDDFPSNEVTQVTLLMKSGDQATQFTAIQTGDSVEIVDFTDVPSSKLDRINPFAQKGTSNILDRKNPFAPQTSTNVLDKINPFAAPSGNKLDRVNPFSASSTKIVIRKESWDQSVISRPLLLRVRDEIVKQTLRFRQVIPEKVTIEEFPTLKRYIFVYVENNRQYEIMALYHKSTDSIRVVGDFTEVQLGKPVLVQTVVSPDGKMTIVSNSVSEVTNVYDSFPVVLNQVQQQTQIDQNQIKKIVVQEITLGEKYTLTVESQEAVSEIQFFRKADTNEIKVIDQLYVPQTGLVRPRPRTGIIVPKDQFSSQPIQQLLTAVHTGQKTIVSEFTTEQVTSITKVDTPFASNYEIVYTTPKGPETVVTTYNEETKEVRIIDYKPVQTIIQPTSGPSKTQVYVEPLNGLKVQQTTNVVLINKNPVIQSVKSALVQQNILKKDSQIVETQTTTSETKVTTKMIAKSSVPQIGQAIVSVYDIPTQSVKIIGHEEIVLSTQKSNIAQAFPHTVYTQTVFDEVIKKDKILPLVITQITSKHPDLVSEKPDTILIDKIGDKYITTVTYEEQKIVSQIVTDSKTLTSEEIDTFTIQDQIMPTVVESTVLDNGKTTIVSNSYDEILFIKPEIKPALTLINNLIPVKKEQIKTISVTENQYTIVTMDQKQQVTQTQFVYQPQAQQPITLIDHQEIIRPTTFQTPKEIIYEIVKNTEPKAIEIQQQVRVLNRTNNILKQNVAQIVKIQKASTNLVEEYKTQIVTSNGDSGNIVIEMGENQQPEIIDIVIYTPQEPVKPVEIIETTNPRTDVLETIYPTVQMFQIDEGYKTVTDFLAPQSKTHQIYSIVKEKYGQNNEYKVLMKSDQHSPLQIDLNINTFNGQVTLMESKTITSKVTTGEVLSKQLPESKELTLSAVEQENVMIISKLSTVKDVEDFDEVKDLKFMEKDEQFVKAVDQLKTMYPSLLSASVIVKILKKDSLDQQQFRVFFNGENNNNIYEAIILTNRITNENLIKSFYKIGTSQTEVEESDLNIGADIAYGYVTLNNFSENENIQFILNYLREHYASMQNALLQSVQILRLEGRKMNYKLFFKINEENVKYIVFYEEEFQRVLHIRSFAFEIGDSYENIDQERMLIDPYFRTVDKYAKEHHDQISEGAKVVASEWKIMGMEYSYRTIYHINGKTFHSSIRIDRETQEVQEDYWNEIISIPSSKFDPEFIPNEQAVKLTVSDLNSNNRFSEIHNKAKQVYSELRDAQLLGAVSRSTLSQVNFILYYSLNGEYYSAKATYNVATHKKVIQEMTKISLTDGYTGVQQGHGSEQTLRWLLKYNPDLTAGVISEISMKSELMGTMWSILVKLPTKYVRVIMLQQGNQYRILNQHNQIGTKQSSPYLMPFPQPTKLVSANM